MCHLSPNKTKRTTFHFVNLFLCEILIEMLQNILQTGNICFTGGDDFILSDRSKNLTANQDYHHLINRISFSLFHLFQQMQETKQSHKNHLMLNLLIIISRELSSLINKAIYVGLCFLLLPIFGCKTSNFLLRARPRKELGFLQQCTFVQHQLSHLSLYFHVKY